MSKLEKLFDITAEIVFILCVTLSAINFNNSTLLWWLMLVPFLRAYRGR